MKQLLTSLLVVLLMISVSSSNCITETFEKADQKTFKILFVFPHPDDESYGPVGAIDKHLRDGHEVHLLTLTKGGATRMRHELGLNMEEMGELRYKEMRNVEKVLNLTSMTVHELPDGGLPELDPEIIEKIIEEHILKINPDVVVTYPVHGISTHRDHIVCHAMVKRVFSKLKKRGDTNLKRLAFFHSNESDNAIMPTRDFITIRESELDCIIKLSEENVRAAHKSLDCYVTYKPMIEMSHVKEAFLKEVHFEFWQEEMETPVGSFVEGL